MNIKLPLKFPLNSALRGEKKRKESPRCQSGQVILHILHKVVHVRIKGCLKKDGEGSHMQFLGLGRVSPRDAYLFQMACACDVYQVIFHMVIGRDFGCHKTFIPYVL